MIIDIDIDNDNDKDLVLGDISYNNLNLLINGGDSQNANMIAVDSVADFSSIERLSVDGFGKTEKLRG